MKTKLIILLTSITFWANAQDVIVTLTAMIDSTALELDSIYLTNLSNASTASLSNFESGIVNYEINLSNINSIEENSINKEKIELYSNNSNGTEIFVKLNNAQSIYIDIIDLTGKKIETKQINCNYGNNLIRVKTKQVSIIRLTSKNTVKSFKSLSNNENNTISKIDFYHRSNTVQLRSNLSEFIFNIGDSIEFTAVKNNYHKNFIVAIPANLDHYYIYLSRPCAGTETVNDYDGNIYNTVQIGNQCWMKENLNTMHYSDGTALVDGTGIPTLDGTTKYWFNYDDEPENAEIYGKLYAWAAVMNNDTSSDTVPSGVQGVCPIGWHVPSKAEFDILVNKFGGESIAGAKLKESSYQHWQYPNAGANNQSGFSALPGGGQHFGHYNRLHTDSWFYTCTKFDGDIYVIKQEYENTFSRLTYYQNEEQYGNSIRCIKD